MENDNPYPYSPLPPPAADMDALGRAVRSMEAEMDFHRVRSQRHDPATDRILLGSAERIGDDWGLILELEAELQAHNAHKALNVLDTTPYLHVVNFIETYVHSIDTGTRVYYDLLHDFAGHYIDGRDVDGGP